MLASKHIFLVFILEEGLGVQSFGKRLLRGLCAKELGEGSQRIVEVVGLAVLQEQE